MKLRRLKDVPFEVAQLLANNQNIVRLLYDDSPSVLITKNNLDIDVNTLIEENYIGFYPASETGIEDVNKNTFIIINLEDFNLQNTDNNTSVSGAVYITTDKAHCLLSNGKLRLLELADEVDNALDGQKISAAGQIRVTSINYIVFSDFRCGYRVNFRLNDQQIRKAEL